MKLFNLAHKQVVIASNDQKLVYESPLWMTILGLVSLIVSMCGWFDILTPNRVPVGAGREAMLAILYAASSMVAFIVIMFFLVGMAHVMHYERK